MLITRSDYERIYKVINSVLINENANPAVSCMYFSMYGSFILEEHFGITANPRAGIAGYQLGETYVLFGKRDEEGAVSAQPDGFHCWVEASGWLIDFMAPAFSRLLPGQSEIPSKMLQKPLASMAPSLSSPAEPGDFFLAPSPQLTADLMQQMTSAPLYGDLAEIASAWFKKAPKKMPTSIGIGGGKSGLRSVPLVGEPLTGTW